MSTEDEYAPISSLAQVRAVAQTFRNVNEIYLNEKSCVVSFKHNTWGTRINVYYTTGTVGICFIHPVSGKVQLFRKDVDPILLKALFTDARLIYGLGYYRNNKERAIGIKRKMEEVSFGQFNIDDDVEDEETELSKQLVHLEQQISVVKEQLKAIETKRQKEKKRLEEEQERIRMEKEAEQARIKAEMERRKAAETARLAAVERNRIATLRGNNCYWSLTYSDYMPESMLGVKCVALAEGGYVVVHDSGSCTYHGIPNNVMNVIEKQHNSMISYIALGEHDQYYIRKTNGRELYNGCEEFMNAIASASTRAKLVSFGDYNTYFIVFDDGSIECSYNLYSKLPSYAYHILTDTDNTIQSVWLGEDEDYYYSSEIPYFIVYNNGNYIHDNIPGGLSDWLENKKRRTAKMKQVLIGQNGNYFVRFS